MTLRTAAPAGRPQLLSLPPELLSMCVEAALSDGSAQLLGTCRQLRNTAAELLAASPDLRLCTAAGRLRQLHRSPDCAWRLYNHGGSMARLLITPPVPGGNGNLGAAASAELAALGALDAALRRGNDDGLGKSAALQLAGSAEAQPGGPREDSILSRGSSERRASLPLLARPMTAAAQDDHAEAISVLASLASRCRLHLPVDDLMRKALAARQSEATVASLVAAGATLSPFLISRLFTDRRWDLIIAALLARDGRGAAGLEELWRDSDLRSVCDQVTSVLREAPEGGAAGASDSGSASASGPLDALAVVLRRCRFARTARSASLLTAFKYNQLQVGRVLFAHGAESGHGIDEYLQRAAYRGKKNAIYSDLRDTPRADPSILDSGAWRHRLGLAVQGGLWSAANVMLRCGARLESAEPLSSVEWNSQGVSVREAIVSVAKAGQRAVVEAVMEGYGGVALEPGDVEAALAAVQLEQRRKWRSEKGFQLKAALGVVEGLLRAWLAQGGAATGDGDSRR